MRVACRVDEHAGGVQQMCLDSTGFQPHVQATTLAVGQTYSVGSQICWSDGRTLYYLPAVTPTSTQ